VTLLPLNLSRLRNATATASVVLAGALALQHLQDLLFLLQDLLTELDAAIAAANSKVDALLAILV
jgi:hypothetical protein